MVDCCTCHKEIEAPEYALIFGYPICPGCTHVFRFELDNLEWPLYFKLATKQW